MRFAVGAPLVLLALFVCERAATACACAFKNPCQAYADADVVFSGVVELVSGDAGWTSTTLVVNEAFRGVTAERVTVSSQGYCERVFEPGQAYVVYARHAEGRVVTDFCSGTKPLAMADDDIENARRMFRQPTATRIFGTVVEVATKPGAVPSERPLAAIPVIIEPIERHRTRPVRLATGRDGRYHLDGVAAGGYRVLALLPRDLRPVSLHAVTVNQGSCVEASFRSDRFADLEGRVLDERGEPAPGVVVIAQIDDGDAAARTSRAEAKTTTASDGRYAIPAVPAGRYVIAVHPVDQREPLWPYATTYLPGTTSRRTASVVTVSGWDRIALPDLTLPPRREALRIAGTVVDTSGDPPTSASVLLSSADFGGGHLSVRVASDGSFEARAFRGQRVVIQAVANGLGIRFSSPRREVVVDDACAAIHLVLSVTDGRDADGLLD